jgi:hypothetical protein
MSRAIDLVLSVTVLTGSPATLAAQRQAAVQAPGEPSVSATRIRADVEFLADDLLEGREAGTRGYDLAARYAASALKAAGYGPGADDGTYFQQVPFIESTPTATSMRLTVNGVTSEVPVPDEGIVAASAAQSTADVTVPVVFAGFGVTATPFGYEFMTASRDIVAFGSENTTLDAVVRKAVGELGYTLSPDPLPDENVFVRSDQYSLVKQGVPAVYLMPGFMAADPAVNGQRVFGTFLKTHYHKPSDDLSLPMDLAAVEKFTRANIAIARAIADDPVDPTWKPGNFFGKMFGGIR